MPQLKTKALVVLSGGQDSTTCLYWAKERYDEVHAITFDYGQRHRREIAAADAVWLLSGAKGRHEVVTLGPILKGTSPLVSDEELEQYSDPYSLPGGLEKTFVPMRNQLFLTIAANRAAVLGDCDVVTGVCEEDFGGYPDCRRVFIDSLERTIHLSLGGPKRIRIVTPLMQLSKAATVYLAADLPGCFGALAFSHTSYDGAYPPTGKDHATLLRAKGFIEANQPDPLVLRAWAEGVMELPVSSIYDNYRGRALSDVSGWIADELREAFAELRSHAA